jgi:hypothetical protein
MAFSSRTVEAGGPCRLRKVRIGDFVVGLAKSAKALKLPIVVTTTARDSMWGPTIPELVEALPGVQIIDRSISAWVQTYIV